MLRGLVGAAGTPAHRGSTGKARPRIFQDLPGRKALGGQGAGRGLVAAEGVLLLRPLGEGIAFSQLGSENTVEVIRGDLDDADLSPQAGKTVFGHHPATFGDRDHQFAAEKQQCQQCDKRGFEQVAQPVCPNKIGLMQSGGLSGSL